MGTRKVDCLATCSSTSGYWSLIVRATGCKRYTEGSRSRVSKHSMIAEGIQGRGNGTKVPHVVFQRHSHRRGDDGLEPVKDLTLMGGRMRVCQALARPMHLMSAMWDGLSSRRTWPCCLRMSAHPPLPHDATRGVSGTPLCYLLWTRRHHPRPVMYDRAFFQHRSATSRPSALPLRSPSSKWMPP